MKMIRILHGRGYQASEPVLNSFLRQTISTGLELHFSHEIATAFRRCDLKVVYYADLTAQHLRDRGWATENVDQELSQRSVTREDHIPSIFKRIASWSYWARWAVGPFYYLARRLFRAYIHKTMPDVAAYLDTDSTYRHGVNHRVKSCLRESMSNQNAALWIAHSMGAIVAFEAAVELEDETSITPLIDLITVGSPLATDFVKHCLSSWRRKQFPRLFRKLISIADPRDIVSADSRIRNDLACLQHAKHRASIVDVPTENTRPEDPHSLTGYLSSRDVLSNIATFLHDCPEPPTGHCT